MSLLQDVLRTQTLDALDRKLVGATDRPGHHNGHVAGEREDDEDELINVVSMPGSPSRSRPGSRGPSPPRSAANRPAPSPLLLSAGGSRTVPTEPLKAFPTDVSQKIFAHLSIRDLARCSRVSRKWNKSQTLNYVWFQHYRKENFHDESLPVGKWSKRESKLNWRTTYLHSMPTRSPPLPPRSGISSPRSGAQTPREIREERWRAEAEPSSKPTKNEMREMYKELGGRKARTKTKLGAGAQGGTRDRGGWADGGGDNDF